MSERQGVVMMKRRQFLAGMGGALLALPLLPSLLEREAQAATRPKNFVCFATPHGGAWFSNMFPAASALTEQTSYAGRTVRRGALTATQSGGTASISTVLNAPSTLLTPAVLGKLNLIAGLDIPWYIGHHTGGHLGNSYANDNNGSLPGSYAIPTIDQVMAYSPSFYPSLGGILRRSLEFGSQQNNRGISFNWSNPDTRSGTIQALTPDNDTQKAFDSVFVAGSNPTPTPTRVPIVDRVFASYQRLRQGSRRLSSADRQRLDEHLTRLQEIQRRITVKVSCGDLQRPTQNANDLWGYLEPKGISDGTTAYQLTNDIIVAALSCGTCRIATVGACDQGTALFSNYAGDWHQSICHPASQNGDAAAEATLHQSYQVFFEKAFLDLVTKLGASNGAGGTLLDDSLVMWTQESCHKTHDTYSVPVITAGGAGGALKTGSYIDYRNMAVGNSGLEGGYNPGLLWNQWLGAVLQAVGVPRSEYETAKYQPSRPSGAGTAGFGWWKYYEDGSNVADYQSAIATLGEIPVYLKP